MSGYILWIILLALWNVILFYGNTYGLSVLLFMFPLLLFVYLFFKKNELIKNKKGLLLMIPILLLSLTYMLYDNELFRILNFPVIIILFGIMYVSTIRPVNRLSDLINQSISVLVLPITYIGNFFRVTTSKLKGKFNLSDKSKKVIKSILIVLPITLIVLVLLSNADMIFGEVFNKIFDKIAFFLEEYLFDGLIGRIIKFMFVFVVIGITMMYLLYEYSKKENVKELVKERKNIDLLPIKLLVGVLNLIYVIFDIIQVKSLMLHSIPESITYAEYARQGFFELLVVSIINIAIILVSKIFETKDNEKEFKFINIMNVLMVFLTIIIIVSSFLRMNIYEAAYGYTTLRLLVYVTLMTETILMIPTVMYIFNSNINILKCYFYIILVAYLCTNFMNIDYMVARRNVNRYYINQKIDLDYLENYRLDNVPVLVELYNKTDDINMKKEIKDYLNFISYRKSKDSIFEYNISRERAEKSSSKALLNLD